MKTILILAGNSTNSKDTSRQRLDRELREIGEGLERAKKRDQFTLDKRLAVRQRDIQRAILDLNPQIVHFCGCSTEEDGLVFENETGQPTLINTDALAEFFELFADRVECVVLNRCYSKEQGEGIAQYIDYVVGTKRAISDRAAIEFVVGFYDALGAGRDYKFAYKLGCNAFKREEIRESLKPLLLTKSDLINARSNFYERKNGVIEILSSYAHNAKRLWRRYIPSSSVRRGQIILLSSLGVTVLVITIRFLGVFQSVEFFFFDNMMSQQREPQDNRLLLIEITQKDIEAFGAGKGASIPDKTIADLLNKLLSLNPKVIGLDIYRELPADKNSGLKAILNDKRVVVICKVADPKYQSSGTVYPPDIEDIERVGFSDFVEDADSVIRRQLLQMNTKNVEFDSESHCGAKHKDRNKTINSFSFKLAQQYLNKKPKEYNIHEKTLGNLVLGKSVLQRLTERTSGIYTDMEELQGYQILLNYRSVCRNDKSGLPDCSPHKIAEIKSVSEVIGKGKNIAPELVKDKIVIIGTNIDGIDYKFRTPFSINEDPQMTGLIMQAQMVSQLVSAAMGKRPLLRVLPIEYEMLWILAGSCVGMIVGQLCRSRRSLIVAGVIVPLSLYFVCLQLFSGSKLWVPFVPTVLTLLGTGGVVVLIRFKTPQSF